jgi:hypothetical protein
MKGVGSREVITHKPVAQACEISFDKTKVRKASHHPKIVAKVETSL